MQLVAHRGEKSLVRTESDNVFSHVHLYLADNTEKFELVYKFSNTQGIKNSPVDWTMTPHHTTFVPTPTVWIIAAAPRVD